MAFTSKLAELFVQFVVKGVSDVSNALTGIHTQLDGIKTGMDQVAKIASIGFASASTSLLGFVRAGTQGTAIGAQLSFQMGQLSRNIAGLFQPEMQKAIDLIRSAVEWMRSLTDQQRANIVRWGEAAAAAALVAIALPRVVAGINLAVTALRALAAAISAGLSATGIGALLPLIGAIVSIVTALVVGTEVGRGALGKFFDVLQQIATTVGGLLMPIFEAITGVVGKLADVFEQIAPPIMAALNAIFQALQPLFDIVGQIADAFGDVLASGLRLFTVVLVDVLTLLTPFLSFMAKLASFALSVLIPVFKTLAFILERVAKLLAYITGVKLDFSKPKHEPASPAGNRRENATSYGGFENIDAIYNRIAQASVQVGKRTDEKQLDVQERSDLKLEAIKNILASKKSAFA